MTGLVERVPLDDAATRIEALVGNWYLAGSELYRRLLAGDLQADLLLRVDPVWRTGPRSGASEQWISLTPKHWEQLEIVPIERGRFGKFMNVCGTLDGDDISSLGYRYFLVHRAGLDRLCPVPKAETIVDLKKPSWKFDAADYLPAPETKPVAKPAKPAPPPPPPISPRTAAVLASKEAAHLGPFWHTIAPYMDAKAPFPRRSDASKYARSLGKLERNAVRDGIKKHFRYWYVEED